MCFYVKEIFELGHGLLTYVLVMTLGEFELNDVILSEPFAPFDLDVRLLLGMLMFLMTIVLMNLTVNHSTVLIVNQNSERANAFNAVHTFMKYKPVGD